MRPDEISNTLKAKRQRGAEASAKLSRRISKKNTALSHAETVALFCVPLEEEDKARRELFQAQMGDFSSSLSFYYHDLGKISAKQKVFLEAFGQSGIVRDACAAARVSRRELARWLEEDEPFREMYEDTEEDAIDDLESVAVARAKANSDYLMALLLKAKRPQKYIERSQVEMTKSKKDKPKKQVWEIGETKLEF